MSHQDRLRAWEATRFAPAPEPDLTPSRPTWIEQVAMPDGVRLYTEIFLPAPTGRFPVVLVRSPYPNSRPSRDDKRPISRYLAEGYAFVFQMTRGQYRSEGTFRFFMDDARDGHDCINWIASQPWSNGSIGMEGSSYVGNTQLLAARTRPPALKCIMPTAFIGNCLASFPFMNGIPARGWWLQWYRILDNENVDDLEFTYGDMSLPQHPSWAHAYRQRPLIAAADTLLCGEKLTSWKETMSHTDAAYWESVHFTDRELAELDLPIFMTAGWLDLTRGPIDYFERLERLRPQRSDRFLMVGPWDHGQTYRSHLHGRAHGEREVPENGAVDLVSVRLAFFARYLKGEQSPAVQPDRVRLFIGGANEWRDYPTYPVPATQKRRLFLHSDGDARSLAGNGTLSWAAPREEPADTYIYDPGCPTTAPIEYIEFLDRRAFEIRADVLTYTSAPLTEPITILGDMLLILHATSDAFDTDWFARLTEVFPDGRSLAFNGAVAAVRARFREGFERELPLVPGRPVEYSISLGPAGHQVAAGNRLRLSIFSAAFPACDPNTNTGKPVATDVDMRVARQTVFHDVNRASHIVIPLI